MELHYTNPISGLSGTGEELYNGNICAINWKTKDLGSQKAYAYRYDGLDRILVANYGEEASSWNNTAFDEGGRNSEPNIGYDLNGNILSMGRNNNTGSKLDNLHYRYTGNRLMALGTGGSNAPATDTYGYDDNGNMKSNTLKGMTVTYNIFNKPQLVDFGNGNKIEYIYDASGNKLQQKVYNTGSLTTTTDYAGSIIYKNSGFYSILTGEGRVTKPTANYIYEYHIKDHLGNTRVAFEATTTGLNVVQQVDYYSFGLKFASSNYLGNDNKYLYNGKELQDDLGLGWYDYGFRFYDPQICRFVSVDPLANKYSYKSPFDYAENNPILSLDLDGLEEVKYNWEKNYFYNIRTPDAKSCLLTPEYNSAGRLIGMDKWRPDSEVPIEIVALGLGPFAIMGGIFAGELIAAEATLFSGMTWGAFTSLPAISSFTTAAASASWWSRISAGGLDAIGQYGGNLISGKGAWGSFTNINFSTSLANIGNPFAPITNGIFGNSFQFDIEHGPRLGTPTQVALGTFTEWGGNILGNSFTSMWFNSKFFMNETSRIINYNLIGTKAALNSANRTSQYLLGISAGMYQFPEVFENTFNNYSVDFTYSLLDYYYGNY
jgi:RHS repeat-associated protein